MMDVKRKWMGVKALALSGLIAGVCVGQTRVAEARETEGSDDFEDIELVFEGEDEIDLEILEGAVDGDIVVFDAGCEMDVLAIKAEDIMGDSRDIEVWIEGHGKKNRGHVRGHGPMRGRSFDADDINNMHKAMRMRGLMMGQAHSKGMKYQQRGPRFHGGQKGQFHALKGKAFHMQKMNHKRMAQDIHRRLAALEKRVFGKSKAAQGKNISGCEALSGQCRLGRGHEMMLPQKHRGGQMQGHQMHKKGQRMQGHQRGRQGIKQRHMLMGKPLKGSKRMHHNSQGDVQQKLSIQQRRAIAAVKRNAAAQIRKIMAQGKHHAGKGRNGLRHLDEREMKIHQQ